MAAFAVIEIRLAKGALAVVTGQTALGSRVRKMLRRDGRADLARLWKPAPSDNVATFATEIAARVVIRVAEAQAESA